MSKNIFFISDTHFGHANMLQFTNYDGTRMRPFNSIEELDELMIENWNEMVKPTDKIYHLGDVVYRCKNRDQIMQRLNGEKVLIKGNHDRDQLGWYMKYFKDIRGTFHIDGNYLLGHFPIHPDSKGRFVRQLHGHCIDDMTEVLTTEGFKKFSEISHNDKVLNLNISRNVIEEDSIKRVISMNYSGDVYYFKSKGIDIRVTEGHRMLYKLYSSKPQPYKFMLPFELIQHSKKSFIRAGYQVTDGIPLTDDMIRLLVWIAADGNKVNTDLIRFCLKKERKIDRLKELLKRLNIQYKEFERKNSFKLIHFTCPKELANVQLKPIDNIILRANKEQAEIILEEYTHTDGRKTGKNCATIYTSKKEEADTLQRLFILNGLGASISTRVNHGFKLQNGNQKISYELQISRGTMRTPQNLKNITTMEKVVNEHFWCLETFNGTLIIRRNGVVNITGNCHAQQVMKYELLNLIHGEPAFKVSPDPWYRNCCVEVNNWSPIPFEVIKEETDKLIEDGIIIIPKK